MKVTIVLIPSDEGFTAYVPAIPSCISGGKTKDEALLNIQEVLTFLLQPDQKKILRDKSNVLFEYLEL